MLNVCVMAEHADGGVKALVYFLDHVGARRDYFVLFDSKAMDPRIYQWFDLPRVLLEDNSVLTVFRDCSRVSDD